MTNTSSTSSSPSDHLHQLPASVRGAPPELRRLIRKRQNSESAKRCRLRRKLEAQRDATRHQTTAEQMASLEAMVNSLAQQLYQTQAAVASLLQVSSSRRSQYQQVHNTQTLLMPKIVDGAIGFSQCLDEELELAIS